MKKKLGSDDNLRKKIDASVAPIIGLAIEKTIYRQYFLYIGVGLVS